MSTNTTTNNTKQQHTTMNTNNKIKKESIDPLGKKNGKRYTFSIPPVKTIVGNDLIHDRITGNFLIISKDITEYEVKRVIQINNQNNPQKELIESGISEVLHVDDEELRQINI